MFVWCIVFLFFIYSSIISNRFVSGQTDYCTTPVCTPRTHTLCIFNPDVPASQCYRYNSSGLLTNNDQTTIVNLHNDLRERVAKGLENRGNPGPQPPASNMKILRWDPELARIAQRYANQCLFQHDICRNVERFGYVGQNIASSCFQNKPNLIAAVNSSIEIWYNEVPQFNNRNVQRYLNFGPSSEYSQLVWANTSYVGCGRTLYQNPSNGFYCYLTICNYGPGGNILLQPVYQTGPAASACTSGVSSTRPSLCN